MKVSITAATTKSKDTNHSLHLSLLLFQHKEALEFCITGTTATTGATVQPWKTLQSQHAW